jgi:hypothetical protein
LWPGDELLKKLSRWTVKKRARDVINVQLSF